MRNCPFCGGDSARVFEKDEKPTRGEQPQCYVRCNKCFARGPIKELAALAMMSWNGDDLRDNKTKSLFEGENNE
ncbi:conserved hypothetical protein [Sulfurovum sp. enrichment culture clone C5]|uniref:Restriction alleviation protein, Lar family n=1 Tax=Sulfurovum sp. enrichment culture clone C5 TaxID=497650 RepID=A0A0S4XMM9_9BACT|nr:conserved hypothetical protein [Sulfurovum sp. enrichment culture clone C5]